MRDYSSNIIYKAVGKTHYVPDALSRPVFQIVRHVSSREDVKLLEGFNAAEMRKEQMKESRWKEMVCFLEEGKLPSKRPPRSLLQNFQIYDGVLYCTRTGEDGSLVLRVVIPQHLCRYTLNVVHDAKASGHPGPRRTFAKAVDLFYWPSMLKDCCEYGSCARKGKVQKA